MQVYTKDVRGEQVLMTTNKKTGKSKKRTGPKQVAKLMTNLEHPFKEEIEEFEGLF